MFLGKTFQEGIPGLRSARRSLDFLLRRQTKVGYFPPGRGAKRDFLSAHAHLNSWAECCNEKWVKRS